MAHTYTLQALAAALGATVTGDASLTVTRLAHPADIRNAADLALAMDPKLLPLLAGGAARAAVVSRKAEIPPGLLAGFIAVDRPRLALSKLTALFAEPVSLAPGIHPTAVIEPGARLGDNVSVGAYTVIAAGAVVGAGSAIHPHVYIGPGATIGADALVYSGVRIGAGVMIGARAIIHFNAAIGADGFSFVTPEAGSVESAKATGEVRATNTHLLRIASLGSVEIGDDVEIGACSCIDRGTIQSTRIGNGTKIDNHVQIGHNVVIGENCMLCGRVGIAGSAVLGNRVVLGGAAGVADHSTIGDDVVAMALSGISGSVPGRSVIGGIPALPRKEALENYFAGKHVKKLAAQVKDLAARLEALEQPGINTDRAKSV